MVSSIIIYFVKRIQNFVHNDRFKTMVILWSLVSCQNNNYYIVLMLNQHRYLNDLFFP